MVFQDFLDFLVFLETSEVAGPGPNPREIDISFGADGPLACVNRQTRMHERRAVPPAAATMLMTGARPRLACVLP